MRVPLPSREDLRRLLALGVPVTIVQLALMALGVEDTMIVGRLGAVPLAAIAVGSIYFWASTAFPFGLLIALEPLIAQALGAREPEAVARSFQRGLLIAGVAGTIAAVSTLWVEGVMRLAGQPEAVVAIVGPYLRAQAWSMYAYLGFILLRTLLQAEHVTAPIVVSVVVANVVNVVLSIGLVFGKWGLPRMGPVGSGVGTNVARFVMLGVLVAATWPRVAPLLRWRRESGSPHAMWNVLKLGTPAGVQIMLEFGVFALVGLLMGNLGAVPVAAHQVALNVASVTFMVPLGISTAGSVLVGRAIGAEDRAGARRSAVAALACGVGFMALTSIVFRLVPGLIARAYTADVATVALASTLIPIAGVFQVFDGLQCVCIGLLRGTGDTRTPMIVNLIGYWGIGLPFGLLLAFRLHRGPVGLWWGLVAGLAVVGLTLLARLRLRYGGPLERVHVEAPHAE